MESNNKVCIIDWYNIPIYEMKGYISMLEVQVLMKGYLSQIEVQVAVF